MNIEKEKKYLVKGLNENILKGLDCKRIIQYYLNIEDKEVRLLVKNLFHLQNLKDIAEVRVRVINGEDFILTAKSHGLEIRKEYEQPILFKDRANELVKDKTIGVVVKSRYTYKGVEIDFLKTTNLCLAEMEYTDMTESEVDEYVKQVIEELSKRKTVAKNISQLENGLLLVGNRVQFDLPETESKIKILDVTHDINYKNKNLMIPIYCKDVKR
jgi:CYTH domain-containing protein